MKLITAVVRPERVQQVKEALFQVGIIGLTLSRVSGHGGEHVLVEDCVTAAKIYLAMALDLCSRKAA